MLKTFCSLPPGIEEKEVMKMKHETVVRFLSAFTVVLMVGTQFGPSVSATSDSGNEIASIRPVDLTEAGQIALLNIEDISTVSDEFSDWNGATISPSATYYDLSGETEAYAFNVTKDGKYAGYILVSAYTDNYPVLECSRGYLPMMSSELAAVSQSAVSRKASIKDLTVKDPIPLYLGATFYMIEYPLVDKNDVRIESVYVDLETQRVFDTSKLMDLPATGSDIEKQEHIKQQEIAVLWSRQTNVEKTTAAPLTRSSNYISVVPFYQWYRGCSPTASAMVLGYWDTHGYPNFPSESTLIDELATAMGTGSSWPFDGATWPYWIDNGIETVASNHGYATFDAIENTWLWGDHFEEMASEIDSVRPFVLSMAGGGAAVGKPTAYGSHSVTGVGYVRGIQNYITIHDTWNSFPDYPLSENRLIANNNWVAAMVDWVRH